MPQDLIIVPSPSSVIDAFNQNGREERAKEAEKSEERIADSVNSIVESFKKGEVSYFEHRLHTKEEALAVATPFIISGYEVFFRKKDAYLKISVPGFSEMKLSPLFFLNPFTFEQKYYFRKLNIDGTLSFTRYKRK